ncbi:MAG: hypothetical protein CMH63_00090 [Nanoarchaeota archaeon]|jgi:hypothetical protein|nr:hypothetical protein [Nanoarchaeota archaeon]|tara:strand:+ start:51 stop:410 length:360 start_codon:yes stop_codon:yes gene_type:complete
MTLDLDYKIRTKELGFDIFPEDWTRVSNSCKAIASEPDLWEGDSGEGLKSGHFYVNLVEPLASTSEGNMTFDYVAHLSLTSLVLVETRAFSQAQIDTFMKEKRGRYFADNYRKYGLQQC